MEQKLTFNDYNEALKKNKLMGLKCKECGTVTVPPKMACRQCASIDMEPIELKGKGKIQTFTTVYVAPEARENEAPYVIVLVELDEGPWIMGNLIDMDPSKATMELMDKRVKMGHKVFPGDRYSSGASARPLFSMED
ncbi:Zn-ribbon domain-containing OB-fold protein [Chloroflexota bacterium]